MLESIVGDPGLVAMSPENRGEKEIVGVGIRKQFFVLRPGRSQWDGVNEMTMLTCG